MAKKEHGQNTYNRIIENSLILFNEQGERNISTNHIAAHLGISPGNLYYHFKNKDEIIVQLFKRYSNALMSYLNTETIPDTVSQFVNYMKGIYAILWEYRFLFNDVNTLLSRSNALLGEHAIFTHERFSPLAIKLLTRLQSNGIIAIDEIGIRDLTINLWLISKYWFDFDRSLYGQSIDGDQIKARGVYRALSLVRPYLKPEYRTEFDTLMNATIHV